MCLFSLGNEDELYQVAISSSIVVFGFDGKQILIYVHNQEFGEYKGYKTLPTIFVKPDENIEIELRDFIFKYLEKDDLYLEQLKAFANVYRYPTSRVVNIAYYTLMRLSEDILNRSSKLPGEWLPYHKIPELAFDHNEIIDFAKERLKRRVKRRPVGFELLDKEFTLTELQSLYESALDKELDKRNFRKKILKSDFIVETGNTTDPEQTRKAAKLYKFAKEKYQNMALTGYDFLF